MLANETRIWRFGRVEASGTMVFSLHRAIASGLPLSHRMYL